MIDEPLTTTVYHCARCDQDHKDMEFQRLSNPIEDSDGTNWEWWGTCPNTGEPVLLKKTEDGDAS